MIFEVMFCDVTWILKNNIILHMMSHCYFQRGNSVVLSTADRQVKQNVSFFFLFTYSFIYVQECCKDAHKLLQDTWLNDLTA